MFEFPKENRLLKRQEFRITLDNGVKIVDSNLVLLGRKTDRPQGRIGLIVSKKVGNAVIRNRVKRRLRERFRLVKGELSGLDLVIIARHTAAGRDTSELFTSFDQCLRRLRKKLLA